jgi:hypothetical protein
VKRLNKRNTIVLSLLLVSIFVISAILFSTSCGGKKALATNVYNVKDYGALGDGAHDDYDAVMATIKAANGAFVYFPVGYYYLSKPLNLSGDVHIRGAATGTGINADGSNARSWLKTTTTDSSGMTSWSFVPIYSSPVAGETPLALGSSVFSPAPVPTDEPSPLPSALAHTL